MDRLPHLDFAALRQLATASDAIAIPCTCSAAPFDGWASVPASFPDDQLRDIGTLIVGDVDALTFTEYDPAGTGYWAVDAPIAPHWFPANRCDVAECGRCHRSFLRYNEGGGYFFDRRIRKLALARLTDA
jgi:hypothetical protein